MCRVQIGWVICQPTQTNAHIRARAWTPKPPTLGESRVETIRIITILFAVRSRDEIDNDTAKSFRPEFAHQIFGENECIFGYKDLKIRIFYTAGPLNIYLGTKYSSKIDEVNSDGLKADEITSNISKLLTTGCYYTNIDEFLAKLDKEESFHPFGEKLYSWNIEHDNRSRTYEIYECNIKTPGFLAFHARLQTFLLWFVDAASYIDIEDPQWMFLVW